MSTRWTELELAQYVEKNPRSLRSNPLSPAPVAKSSKYRNKRTEVDGIVFDSKREASRYRDLKLRERFNLISDLKRQVTFPLTINGVHICSYRADFEYMEDGQRVIEDSKGVRTREYKIKRNLMQALYGITIRET